jgi:translation initiation factor eIF-2B subunit beta
MIRLLTRRQIKGSKQCAIATTQLFFRVVSDFKGHQVDNLLERVRSVGLKLISAQPKELVVGNIVRRILGLIREAAAEFETKSPNNGNPPAATAHSSATSQTRPRLTSSVSSFAPGPDASASLFGLFLAPNGADAGAAATPPGTPTAGRAPPPHKANSRLHSEVKADVFEGLREILAEINLASEQISEAAPAHVNGDDVLLVQGGSRTARAFLAAAAHRRGRFTVFCVEGAPNDAAARAALLAARGGGGQPSDGPVNDPADSDSDDDDDGEATPAPLASRGVSVVLIPDAAVHAVMPYVNKVLLAPHAVLANGGLAAPAGARSIARAARASRVPVLALAAVYRLSPVQPVALRAGEAGLCEVGGAGQAGGPEGAWEGVGVENPLWDYVEPGMVDLYITNL